MPESPITRMEYHEKLNVVLAATGEGTLLVLDTNLGEILYTTKIGERIIGNIPESPTQGISAAA